MSDRDDSQLAEQFGLTLEQLDTLRSHLTTAPGFGDFKPSTPTWSMADGPTEEHPAAALQLPPRYADLGLLGMGGMGEVRRVRDTRLNRTVAMKILHRRDPHSRAESRFIEEAQTSAQLEHPGLLPIYDTDRLADGRLYFTMQEVHGQTLAEVIEQAHEGTDWTSMEGEAAMRRLVSALHQAAVAVGYAHERGVIHRDIKPTNILVGTGGAVLVVDWGIARVSGTAVVVDRRLDTPATTMVGTPQYMAPEQARGEPAQPTTDVWALGAVLYEALSGAPPHSRLPASQLMAARREGVSPDPPRCPRPIPAPIDALLHASLAADPAVRPRDAAAFADALWRWLDGESRREAARAKLTEAAALRFQAGRSRSRAADADARATVLLAEVPAWAPEEDKAAGWAEEDAAEAHRQAAVTAELAAEHTLHLALSIAPGLFEARLALASRYRALHAQAEQRRDAAATARAAAFLTAQLDALPDDLPAVQGHRAYLTGTGALTLVTDPPGATVTLHRMVTHRRRLVAEPVRALGTTPLREVSLAPGSWLLTLTHPACETVRYPVLIGRQEHWHGVPPGGTAPLPVPLPPKGSLSAGEVYVPPGWFQVGGDPRAANGLPGEQWWCHGFIIDRDPVTNRRWLAWANTLLATEGEEAALAAVPRDDYGIASNDNGQPIYHRDASGRFILGPDPDGDIWEQDWPVVMITAQQMQRFAAWTAAQTRQPWRLPAELEWEKAARGVDGRLYPWGDRFDPAWCSSASSRPQSLYRVDEHPVDTSVYGVRGMGGNACDTCLEPRGVVQVGPTVVVPPLEDHSHIIGRGGAWSSPPGSCRAAARGFSSATRGLYSQTVRLVRRWEG